MVIGPAVPGQQLAPAGPLPPEGVGPLEGVAAEVGVDGHAEGVDAGVEQHVDQRPALAVDVAVHAVADGEAVVVAQCPEQLHALDQLVGVEEGREVGEHAGHLDATGLLQRDELVDLGLGRVVEPLLEHVGRLDRPAEGAVGVGIGILVGQAARPR